MVASLKRVTGTQRVEATNIDIPKMERDYIGIGIHRPDGSGFLAAASDFAMISRASPQLVAETPEKPAILPISFSLVSRRSRHSDTR